MTGLIIIDVQRDFCPGGALAVPDGDAVIGPINRLVQEDLPVVATQDWHPEDHLSFASQHDDREPFETVEMPYGEQTLWPDHCVQGSPGAEFHEELDSRRIELMVRKGFRREIDSYSAFRENDRRTTTGLAGYLREHGVTDLVMVGLATDFCVKWSVQDARREGFSVTVLEDAVRGIDLGGSVDRAWAAIRESGARVQALDEWLAARSSSR